MKYCARCNETYEPHITRCAFCGLALTEVHSNGNGHGISPLSGTANDNADDTACHAPGSPLSGFSQTPDTGNHSPDAPSPAREDPAKQRPRGETLFTSLLTVAGSAFGLLLLLLAAGVLVFSVFRGDIFGKNPKDNIPEQSAQVPMETGEVPTTAENTLPPITIETLPIDQNDVQLYAELCRDAVWVDESSNTALTFNVDNTYLCSDLQGNSIFRGEAAVSGGLLYMNREGGELEPYKFSVNGNILRITDKNGISTTYVSGSAPVEDETPDLFDYPVSAADLTSYAELVENSPWTDINTGNTLNFYSDNTYISETPDGPDRFGSAVVSGGRLCIVSGSQFDTVYECDYTLTSGVLTITFETNSWSLLSDSAYQAMLLREQLDEELYRSLVSGSHWCSRGDQYIYNLYFYDDHTFALYSAALYSGEETLIRDGEAEIREGTLILKFEGTSVTYEVTMEGNMLYLYNVLAGGGTEVYETNTTFHY